MSTPDTAVLAAVIESSTGRSVTAVHDLERLTGGSSREIWAFTAAMADGDPLDLVLRRDPPGEQRVDGAGVERAVMAAAHAAGVPVPRIFHSTGVGDDGIVMDRVRGETSPQRILDRDDLAGARTRLSAQCGDALGRLHSIDIATLGSVLQREDRLVSYRETLDRLDRNRPVLELAHRWLLDEAVSRHESVVVHGDFRNGNFAVDADGLSAVLDWESAHIGDPLEDIGWIAVKAWRFRGPGVIGGFGDPAEFLEAYAGRSSSPVTADEFRWALVLNTWIWAVGCLQQASRHLSGAQRSIDLAMVGRRVVEIERDLLELIG